MATNPKDVTRHHYTLEEYFALEDASDARFEYWDGDIVCMSGGSRAHGTISSNVHFALALGVRGGRCRAFIGDMAVPTLRDYLLVSQDEPRVTHYSRLEDGGWKRRDVTGLGASLELESVGCALKLSDVYDGLTFTA
jgi:Uma2 family endonuclease